MQDKHTKMNNLHYEGIKMQNYFYRNDINNEQKKLIFKFRTRMANFGDNHQDKQELSYTCKVIKNEVQLKGVFEDIYGDKISKHTIETLEKITEVRKNVLTNNKPLPLMAQVSQGTKPSAA